MEGKFKAGMYRYTYLIRMNASEIGQVGDLVISHISTLLVQSIGSKIRSDLMHRSTSHTIG
jgi:hypothetical protein